MTKRRVFAVVLGALIFVTLAVRVQLTMEQHGYGVGEALWRIFRFFTIWTNTLIGLCVLGVALGRGPGQRIMGGLVLAIAAVGVVYHTLLAEDLAGLERVIDVVVHTAVPLGFTAFWLVFEPKDRVSWGDIPWWLAYPGLYCVYGLARAQSDGIYPYPFLDIEANGSAQVSLNIVGLLVAFALVGGLIVLVAKGLSGRGTFTSD